jgi:spore coat polysaccharide biosynthesis predicted glycosyltransferase SpsG
MAERMRQADFSIGAAGSTSWERCCLGLASITVILAENQRLIGEALEKKGCAILVEERNIAKDLSTIVNRLMSSGIELEKLANSAENVCDGHGCARLVTEMMRKNRL